jgi:hypothetical protein
MNSIEIFSLQQVSSIIAIILCVTVFIRWILNKMTVQETDIENEAEMIRALVLAHGRNGATLKDIKRNDFLELFKLSLNYDYLQGIITSRMERSSKARATTHCESVSKRSPTSRPSVATGPFSTSQNRQSKNISTK